MIVFSLNVSKVEPTDPRFPGWDAIKESSGAIIGFTALYLCEMQTSEGPMETPFFMTDRCTAGKTTQENLAIMLELFAKAVREAKADKAA